MHTEVRSGAGRPRATCPAQPAPGHTTLHPVTYVLYSIPFYPAIVFGTILYDRVDGWFNRPEHRMQFETSGGCMYVYRRSQ